MCAGAVAAQSNAAPHPPQLLRSVFVFVSHPAAAVQSPYPDRHAYWQLELTQPVTLMFGGSVAAQLVLHPPQFAGSLVVFTSQPVVSFTSQSAYPAVHVPMSHVPDAHSPAAFAYRVVQSFPQLPQFVGVVTSVSHPFTAVQSAHPAVHDPSVHTPTLQYAVAFAKSPVQSFPQLPQFTVSVFVLVSQPSRLTFSSALQSPYPLVHVMLHCAPMQLGAPWLLLHAVPHPPQLEGFVLVSVSHPSRVTFSFALQLLHPVSHAIVHAASTQVAVPWLVLHAALHAPQCAVVVFRFTSQPLVAMFPSQSANPALHTYWQLPSEHPVATMFSGA
jgi:hypothetical protein